MKKAENREPSQAGGAGDAPGQPGIIRAVQAGIGEWQRFSPGCGLIPQPRGANRVVTATWVLRVPYRGCRNRVICATAILDSIRTEPPASGTELNPAARCVLSCSKKGRAVASFSRIGDGAGNAVLQQKIPRPAF